MLRSILILLCFFLCLPPLWAEEQKTFEGETTVNIQEKDIVYARRVALRSLEKDFLHAGILDLLGQDLYQEYQGYLERTNPLDPLNFLISVKVLKEQRTLRTLTMRVRGTLDLRSLAEKLSSFNLILKDDPWFQITLLAQTGLSLPQDEIEARLARYHLRVKPGQGMDQAQEQQDHSSKAFIQLLFEKNPTSHILFYLDQQKDETGLVKGVRTNIYRKSDLELVAQLQYEFEQPLEAALVAAELAKFKSRFVSLYTLESIKRASYEAEVRTSMILEVSGLESPLHREVFEELVLQPNRRIASFAVLSLTSRMTRYRILTRSTLEQILDGLLKPNDAFALSLAARDANFVNLIAQFKQEAKITPLVPWTFEPGLPLELTKVMGLTEEQTDKTKELWPEQQEQEPNNNGREVNLLPAGKMMLGRISSRADEDIFELQNPKKKSKSLKVEWYRLGKTDLSPQLRLYGDGFVFLNSYQLIGNQTRLVFDYHFPQDPPEKIYLRISDRIGFIQGETGGFKAYNYLLRYQWQ